METGWRGFDREFWDISWLLSQEPESNITNQLDLCSGLGSEVRQEEYGSLTTTRRRQRKPQHAIRHPTLTPEHAETGRQGTVLEPGRIPDCGYSSRHPQLVEVEPEQRGLISRENTPGVQ